MRQFMTTAVEQRKVFSGNLETHPMESAWAGEAIFFIKIDEVMEPGSHLNGQVQISVDGVFWVDEGTRIDDINVEGISFIRVKHFGGWLRIKGNVVGTLKLSIHLVLKE